MAEYIDKSLILAGLNLRLQRLKNEHENINKIAELENVIGAISETEIEDVIERSEIDNAIEELQKEIEENHLNVIEYAEGEWIVKDFVYGAIERFKSNIGE